MSGSVFIQALELCLHRMSVSVGSEPQKHSESDSQSETRTESDLYQASNVALRSRICLFQDGWQGPVCTHKHRSAFNMLQLGVWSGRDQPCK